MDSWNQRFAGSGPDLKEHDMNRRRETGWCLEKGTLSRPQFLTIVEGHSQWTPAHLDALRFARREDAERVASLYRDTERVVEHLWA